MVPIDMSMDARMVLAKMSFIYEKEGGDRVRITRDEDIIRIGGQRSSSDVSIATVTLPLHYLLIGAIEHGGSINVCRIHHVGDTLQG